jgi:F5/8 type C domain-containing protein
VSLLALLAAAALVTVRVDTTPLHRLNTVSPLRAIGAGIDSDPPGKIPLLYSPPRVQYTLDAGLGALSYRLYTELSIQDWHWNPAGRFSDAAHDEGYWTSSASGAPIVGSYGYRLPRRGSTRDQGDDDGFSRMDDGDPKTYWKSDPYLSSAYTHEPDSAHPQWAMIDFERPQPIDAIRIAWAEPYATRFDVQYWTGGDAMVDQPNGAVLQSTKGAWRTFSGGTIRRGNGGDRLIRLAPASVNARYLRVLMFASSGTCARHFSLDRRDCVGYAIRELSLGYVDGSGGFHDLISHSTCGGPPDSERSCKRRQTTILASSVDPWHRQRDKVQADQEQPGLDIISRSRITRGLPVMYPVPLFYSTPENAAAEIRYLRSRGYPISFVEMGEEVDGQYAMPEDYGALYVEWADAIHRVDPSLRLGGPVFDGTNSDVTVWPDERGDGSWLHRFLRYLKRRGRLGDLAFMSFEHYPFRGCDQGAVLRDDLLREPSLVRGIVAAWRADGLPKGVPMYITESNFAADSTPVPHQLGGALWMADWIGTALSVGVSGINYYQYEAEPLGHSRKCGLWGGYGLFITESHFKILARAAQYYAAQMLAREWFAPVDDPQPLFAAKATSRSDPRIVTAYAARRPDGEFSIMLVNKDDAAHPVRVWFTGGDDAVRSFTGTVDVVTFGKRQYAWKGRTADELPSPNDPPSRSSVRGAPGKTYLIPPESITVLRGRIAR